MSDFSQIEGRLTIVFGYIQTRAKKILCIEAEKSVQKNFDVGGRPKWAPRKHISKKQRGTNILVIRGALRNVRALETETGIVLVTDPRARAYSQIHNEGGVINMPGRALKLRKKKYGETTRTVFASSKHKRIYKVVDVKPYKIEMPKREFLVIPPEDYPGIINAIKEGIRL